MNKATNAKEASPGKNPDLATTYGIPKYPAPIAVPTRTASAAQNFDCIIFLMAPGGFEPPSSGPKPKALSGLSYGALNLVLVRY